MCGGLMILDGGPTPTAFTARTQNSLSEFVGKSSRETEHVGIGDVLTVFHDDSMYLST